MLKKAQVIMLPTKDKGVICIRHDKPTILLNVNIVVSPFIMVTHKHYHLYIISDDEIKDGDWCYSEKHKDVVQVIANPVNVNNSEGYSKIIATTDTSLNLLWNHIESINLPQPSKQFIEKYIESYNKGEVITDVLIEYEYIKTPDQIFYANDVPYRYDKLKVNPKDNTITIKKLKDSWNREEVKTLIRKAITDTNKVAIRNVSMDSDKWIEENI